MAALASLEDYAIVAGTDVPTGDDATRITRLIELASAAVERYCGRAFEEVADDEVAITVTTGALRLPNGPVSTLTSVTLDDEEVDLDGVTVNALGYVSGSWACGTYEVVYTHGFDPIPDDVIDVVCSLVWARVNAGTPGVSQESLGDWSASYGADVASAEAQQATLARLDPYRVSVGRIVAL